jgi:hypothetical protein
MRITPGFAVGIGKLLERVLAYFDAIARGCGDLVFAVADLYRSGKVFVQMTYDSTMRVGHAWQIFSTCRLHRFFWQLYVQGVLYPSSFTNKLQHDFGDDLCA